MKKTRITQVHTCAGVYDGKPYKNGRLVVASYEDGNILPAWIKVERTSAEIAAELATKVPADVTLFYDNFKNVVGYKLIK